MLGYLLVARWHMAVNSLRGERHGVLRVTLLALLGLAFAAAIYGVSYWFFVRCMAVEPIGEVVIRRILGMSLMVVFSLLTFSNLIGAFSSFYLAEDLQLLVPRPLHPYTLYTSRFLETSLYASWMIVPFSSPIFICAGQLFGAGSAYYLTLAGIYLALTVIPTSVGVLVSLLLTSILSARRARHLFVFAGTLALAVLLLMFRQLQPEQFMNPDLRAPLLETLNTLRGTDAAWLPSTWALAALWPHLGYGVSPDLNPMLLLMSTSAMMFFVCGWVFRLLYPRAFSRAQEGLETGVAADPARSRRALGTLVARARRGRRRLSLSLSLLHKDLLVFVRDTTQWSQLLILVAIIAIYVINFKYIRVITGTGLISDIGLHFLNLALAGFVAMALAVRFVFPAVSLEGPAFWLIRTSPNSMQRFLWAKARSWAYPLALFTNLLTLVTHVFLATDPILAVASVVTITSLVGGLSGLGIGLGARYPRFDTDNAAKIATGLGGVLYMISGAVLLTMVVIASILPTITTMRYLREGYIPSDLRLLLALASALLVIALPTITTRISIAIGARHLDRWGS
jgi:ABC-2 type transport system permease protein